MAPDASSSRAFSLPTELRPWLPTWKTTPVFFCAAITASPSPRVCTIGFSQYTGFFASSASTEICRCQWSGVAMMTASTSGRASTSR